MPITNPPLWQWLLLENPWPLMIALVIAAVLALLVRRQARAHRGQLALTALILLVLAGGAYGLAAVVATDHEQLLDRTRQLVAAAHLPLRSADLDDLLTPSVTLTGPDGRVWMPAPVLRLMVERSVEHLGVSAHHIVSLGAESPNEGEGRSLLSLTSYSKFEPGVPVPSTWELHWRRDRTGRWRVVEIRWLRFAGQRPQPGAIRY